MPESRPRKRTNTTSRPPAGAASSRTAGSQPKRRPPSPPWVGISIAVTFAIGIVYLVLYYVTGGGIVGQRNLGAWNILIGFAFIVAGFGLLTQWR